MKGFNILIVIFAMIGVISVGFIATHYLINVDQVKKQILSAYNQQQSGQVENKTSLLDDSNQGGLNNSVLPTLNPSLNLPQTELIDCWQKTGDGTYQYNFGQISKEECIAKVNKLKAEWEKSVGDTVEKQTDLNNKSSLIVPNELEFK